MGKHICDGPRPGTGIEVRDSDSIGKALDRFQSQVKYSDRLYDYLQTLEYTKPSKERREDQKARNKRKQEGTTVY